MVEKLTDVLVGIEGEPMRPVTLVIIEEIKSGDWGIGGKPVTTADVQAMATGDSPKARLIGKTPHPLLCEQRERREGVVLP